MIVKIDYLNISWEKKQKLRSRALKKKLNFKNFWKKKSETQTIKSKYYLVNWSLKKYWFIKTLGLSWGMIVKCPGQLLGNILHKWTGECLCEVILEVSGHMFPGSGLQTETGSSDWETFFLMRQKDKW